MPGFSVPEKPPTPKEGDQDQLVEINGEIIRLYPLTPDLVLRLKEASLEGKALCPACQGELFLELEPSAHLKHKLPNPYANHEKEDLEIRECRTHIYKQMHNLFPNALVKQNVHLPQLEVLSDIVISLQSGALIAIEVQKEELTHQDLQNKREQYKEEGIQSLWLLDSRRVKQNKTHGEVRQLTLGKLETALLREGQPLIYFYPRERGIVWVHPRREALELAQLGEKEIGRVDSVLRYYRLSQLRIRQGSWWVDTRYDSPWPLPPKLSARLQKKLEKRREKSNK